ncbi:MAG: outer membrane beta-barrel protein [Rhodobacteraceae bacterium]|nr:outer membrane beta-barrel protein [Paracoccaceae bacterium]
MRRIAAATCALVFSATISSAEEWQGSYGGFQLGNLSADTEGAASVSGDGQTLGVHLGYGIELGQYVLGGEVDYDTADVTLGAGLAEIDSLGRLKVRAGTGLGQTLVYGTAGIARADTSLGDETGYFLGAGIGADVGSGWVVGGEVLYHTFRDIDGSGIDADATTLGLRASFRF